MRRSDTARLRKRSGRAWILVVAAIFGVGATALLARNVQTRERALFETELESRVQDRVHVIEQELHDALEHVRSVAALVTTSGEIDRERFRGFAAAILDGHGAIQALGYDPVVPGHARARHEESMRSQGFPSYAITERASDGRLIAALPRDEYVVAALIEPLRGNESAHGFDIASEPRRRAALDLARDTGEPAVTAGLQLVQEAGQRVGVLVCVPVYGGDPPLTRAERRERVRGYAVGVIGIGDLVDWALASLQPAGIHLALFDSSAPTGEELLHFHRSRAAASEEPDPPGREQDPLAKSYRLPFAGRDWRIRATPTQRLRTAHASRLPVFIWVFGLSTTTLVVGYVALQRATTRRLAEAIAERERADERTGAFGRMLDESSNEIYVFDAYSLRFLHANRGAIANVGYSAAELSGMTPLDLKPELSSAEFAELLRPLREGTLPEAHFTTTHRRKDGSTYDVDVHLQRSSFDAAPVFVAMILDVTERKRMEDGLSQAQRLESLGTLAGGIAHDFNNVLTAIMGNAELGQSAAPAEGPLRGYLDEIAAASERAREVVRQILTFSRRGPIVRRPVDLAEVGKGTLRLMRASLPATITIREAWGEACRCVGDPTQIHQVLMNLCTNAAQAMGESGGTLDVRLDSVKLIPGDPLLGDLEPGRYSRISVRDTGPGIPTEFIDRIFDPFFTTKQRGEGTGMGLSVAHGIVTGHGGRLTVSNETGGGAVFEVYLPVDESDRVETPVPELLSGRGTESILVVDDEPAIAELLGDLLRRAGYRVESYTDSIEAFEAFRMRPRTFDLIVTDYTMPKMTGVRLARLVQEVAEDTPVVLVSGYGELIDEVETRHSGVRIVLNKPLRARELTVAIRGVLDGDPTLGASS